MRERVWSWANARRLAVCRVPRLVPRRVARRVAWRAAWRKPAPGAVARPTRTATEIVRRNDASGCVNVSGRGLTPDGSPFVESLGWFLGAWRVAWRAAWRKPAPGAVARPTRTATEIVRRNDASGCVNVSGRGLTPDGSLFVESLGWFLGAVARRVAWRAAWRKPAPGAVARPTRTATEILRRNDASGCVNVSGRGLTPDGSPFVESLGWFLVASRGASLGEPRGVSPRQGPLPDQPARRLKSSGEMTRLVA